MGSQATTTAATRPHRAPGDHDRVVGDVAVLGGRAAPGRHHGAVVTALADSHAFWITSRAAGPDGGVLVFDDGHHAVLPPPDTLDAWGETTMAA